MNDKNLKKLINKLTYCKFCGKNKKSKLGLAVNKGPIYQIYCSRCGCYGPFGSDEKEAGKKWDKSQN